MILAVSRIVAITSSKPRASGDDPIFLDYWSREMM